uniref:Uncharacterized protein n=1 Tax=Strigamia maritima TaxID=126957 RepID=T1J984_STRMM
MFLLQQPVETWDLIDQKNESVLRQVLPAKLFFLPSPQNNFTSTSNHSNSFPRVRPDVSITKKKPGAKKKKKEKIGSSKKGKLICDAIVCACFSSFHNNNKYRPKEKLNMHVPLVIRWTCSLTVGAIILLFLFVVISWVLMAVNNLFICTRSSLCCPSPTVLHPVPEEKHTEAIATHPPELASVCDEFHTQNDHDSDVNDAGDAGANTDNKDERLLLMMPEDTGPNRGVEATTWRTRDLPMLLDKKYLRRGNRKKFPIEKVVVKMTKLSSFVCSLLIVLLMSNVIMAEDEKETCGEDYDN